MTLQVLNNQSIEFVQPDAVLSHHAKPNINCLTGAKMHMSFHGANGVNNQDISRVDCTCCDNWEQWTDDLTKCDLQGFSLRKGKLVCDICGERAE